MSEHGYWQSSALPWQAPLFGRLCGLAGEQKLPHAVLLTGPRGAGKAHLAAALASQLLCKQPGAAGACGHCDSCELVRGGGHGDLRWLVPEEGKRAIGIDAVRSVVGFMQQTPAYGEYKVLVVDPAEAMTTAAANAFLKTLEEPPGQAVILMTSNRPGDLLATVRSRCSLASVPVAGELEAIDWLMTVSGCDTATAEQALVLAGGQPLLGAEMLAEGMEERILLATGLARHIARGGGPADELRGLFDPFDIETALDTAVICLERAIRKAPGANGVQTLFHQRDQLLAWLAATRRGVNLGREPLLGEVVRGFSNAVPFT